MGSLMHYSAAGGAVHLVLLLHSKRCSDGCSVVVLDHWVILSLTWVLHHFTFSSCPETIYCIGFGKQQTPSDYSAFSIEERTVIRHFHANHSRSLKGRFTVPLPRNLSAKSIGESRSQSVRRFLSLERSLTENSCFKELDKVIQEYFSLGHAEPVPSGDLEKPVEETFYMPVRAVYKESSTTTKVRAVFDASAKSATGVSLNDTLLVGPTIHPPLVDVLLLFRSYPVALTTDINKMYRAIELTEIDCDVHCFVWRSESTAPLCDYRMTRATFGVSASLFAAKGKVSEKNSIS